MLAALEAAGEATRLRILALLADGELTVTELMTILGQSQPRVSRHLKLLVEAGLVDRHREGAWAFFRFAEKPVAQALRAGIVAALDPADDILAGDRRRLEAVRAERRSHAAAYFAAHAADWNRIRALHVPEAEVEAAILALLGGEPAGAVLDLGTGTGRMLEMLAPGASRAVGLDVSPAMLAVARVNLDAAGLKHVQLRQGDAYALPPDLQRFDLVILHQVLHYLDDPARAVREAARALRPGGRLLIVDLAPHQEEALRERHAHRRLGFSPAEIESFLAEAGLAGEASRLLRPGPDAEAKLAVSLWLGRDTRIEGDFPLRAVPGSSSPHREVA
ncbi:MAG: metalloregulator ArsR/SmtB family transcription factor [Hyphomicrobiales bacterium]|nr:metalloregulator ArsR/SmtB family transcription factor [Rhabdaerophilum calidifontis]MCA1951848.1 metalloregulator ArsR/SmtB family transcription factor [Hyphomicrobiales bacterium]MCA1998678.1 metalloregulator ArsR/SmtB family transcription factor [Hyphomicrobiales bacterium]